jgi:hypothetical protein
MAGSFARMTRSEPAFDQAFAPFLSQDLALTGEQAVIHPNELQSQFSGIAAIAEFSAVSVPSTVVRI